MSSRSMLGAFAAAVIFWAALAGAAFADEYADAVRQISAPPRSASSVGAREFSVWDGTTATRPTIDGRIVKITSAAELAWLATSEAKAQFTSGVEIDIEANIDLGGHEWTPIVFDGGSVTVNGNGHVIKGLMVRASNTYNDFGLFSTAYASFNASDLHLTGVDISCGPRSLNIGALVGNAVGSVTIEGCTVQGRISSDGAEASVGGFVGKATGGGSIKRCVAEIAVHLNGTGYGSVGGGLVGRAETNGVNFSNCAVYGSVYVKGRAAGGVVGLGGGSGVSFSNLANNADVTLVCVGSDSNNASYGAGGIVGIAGVNGYVTISSSTNYGAIEAEGAGESTNEDIIIGAGGIIGTTHDQSGPRVESSANTASVSMSATSSHGPGKIALCGAGGVIGAVYYDKMTVGHSIERTINSGSITSIASAGGLIGAIKYLGNNQDPYIEIHGSYSTGAITGTGEAGGIIGATINEGADSVLELDRVYSSGIITGGLRGGIVGSKESPDFNPPTDGKAAFYQNQDGLMDIGGETAADLGRDLSSAASFADASGASYQWSEYFLTLGSMPPALDRRSSAISQLGSISFEAKLNPVLRSPLAYRRANGDIAIRLIELPDGATRASDANEVTYEISVGEATIARGLRLDDDVLTIPSNDVLVKGKVLTIRGSNGAEALLALDVPDVPDEPVSDDVPIGGEVLALAVRGTPLTPSEDATIPLYLEWTDADGEVHSSDLHPSGEPTITWSIVAPNAPNWDVSVSAIDPFSPTLSISDRKAQTPSCQEFGVQVRVSYDDDEEIVYTRKFFAGSFPTQVLVGPEQQEMIDAANAVLARSNVSILPGNFQPVISGEFIKILEQRIADGLVRYVTDSGIAAAELRASDDPREIYVLDDMSQIEALMTPTAPDPESLPVCFASTGKQSANISLDISESTLASVAPDAAGKIVLLPMTYSVTFESDDMTDLFGDVADEVLAAPSSDLSLGRIFQVLVLHKRIKEGDMNGWYTRLVSGVATPIDARGLGMMEVDADPESRELTVRLAYNVINYAGESFVISDPANAPGLGYIILPDGQYNATLIDPLWPNIWKRSQDDAGSSSGGGGCDAGAAIVALAAIAAIKRRAK